MRRRALELFLLIGLIIGGSLAWQTGRERSRLSKERARLAGITGDLLIEDSSKVHVLALETGDPMHFAWRVYYPPSYDEVLTDNIGSWGSSRSSYSSEFIGRVVFRQDEEGRLQYYTNFRSGNRRTSLGDRALAELVRNRWDKIRVEQLAAPGLVVLGPKQPAILLRLTLPDDLRAEARKKLSTHTQKHHVSVLFELDLGPKAAKP